MGYEFMEKAVDELCHAMENDPNRFSVGVHTMEDRKTGIEYWIGGSSRCGYITQTWNGASTHRVFSSDQGERLGRAFDKMRETKASRAQERILRGSESENPKPSGGFAFAAAAVVVALLVISIFSALAS